MGNFKRFVSDVSLHSTVILYNNLPNKWCQACSQFGWQIPEDSLGKEVALALWHFAGRNVQHGESSGTLPNTPGLQASKGKTVTDYLSLKHQSVDQNKHSSLTGKIILCKKKKNSSIDNIILLFFIRCGSHQFFLCICVPFASPMPFYVINCHNSYQIFIFHRKKSNFFFGKFYCFERCYSFTWLQWKSWVKT